MKRGIAMTDYTEIVNAYMKFFACHLLESVDDTKTKMYFEDIYSFKKQFHKNIEKCIYELHIPDINSTKEKDILALLDAVISSLRNKIRNQLKEIDSRERKNIFYMLAAFQAEFHGRVNVIADGADLDLTSAHPLERCILELAKNKEYIFEIKAICAIDKYTLQMIFQECLMAQHIQEGLMGIEMSTEIFAEIYGNALTVIELIGKRWMLLLGVLNNPTLKIANGRVDFQEGFVYDMEKYVSKFETDTRQYQNSYPENVRKLLDNNFQKMYGFRVDTLEKMAGSMPKLFVNNNLVTESNYATIVKEIMLTSNCMLGEAEKIFAYMLVDESKEVEKLSESPEKDNNRLFEKCILRVGKDRYLYSHILIGYAYLILLRKLEFNLLEKCERLNAPIIDKNIKKKFEEETQLYIKQYCSNVLLNVHKLDDGAVLSNEVDVMFAMNGNLYIVECKDVTFRYTPNGFIADVRKEREFVKDMIAKRKSVIDNITYFERKFEQKINEVKGYLVYRTTNFVTETVKEDKNVVLVSFEKFKRMLSRM